MSKPSSGQTPKRIIPAWAILIAAVALGGAAYYLYREYGAAGTEAETIVYGMLAFLLGIVLLAAVTFALLRFVLWLLNGKKTSFLDRSSE